jgi:hypothetical protein
MLAILSDYDVKRHLDVLMSIWTSSPWSEVWESLSCQVHSFRSLGLPRNLPDAELWMFCQAREMLLLTGNRNSDGDNSLEATSRKLNQPNSLPILTIANAERLIADRAYAEQVASRIIDILVELESLRGTRRLYVP